ncbi:MAG: response regulator, partial [bacterium]
MIDQPSKPSILIVDDDPNVVLGLRNILEDEYLVETATDCATAIRVQRAKRCDVVILDMLMPGRDGYETALE